MKHTGQQSGLAVLAAMLLIGSGCTTEPPDFRFNSVEYLKMQRRQGESEVLADDVRAEINDVTTAWFGTPQEPHFPFPEGQQDEGHDLIDLEKLRLAAGPVKSDRQGVKSGLYRAHCAQCHGITGDGHGPTSSFLNPYPRDFRLGRFKFKSTPGLMPPTDDDLEHTIRRGIPGTAMPSFALLEQDEIEALVDYVKYLSVRGQVERNLINQIPQLDADRGLLDLSADAEETVVEQIEYLLEDTYWDVLDLWLAAAESEVSVPGMPAGLLGDAGRIDAGRELFLGKANCAECHGRTGLGDGQTENYDLWTSNWLETPGVAINRPETYQEFLQVGVFPPRTMRPRNLRLKVFRGGDRPEDVFLRVKMGIDGTPMPGASALSDEEIWSIVAYLFNMPQDNLTNRD